MAAETGTFMDIRQEPSLSAERVGLTYVSDTEPGYRRRRAGKGFCYFTPRGRYVRDKETLSRIRGLVIPPAWTDVWICREPSGHIQATGRDDRGRKQYRYHEKWTACRDATKFSSLTGFARALPRLRERVDADLRRHGLVRERVLASVVRLLDSTLIRVGNEVYARQNKSFGLTTLRARHLEVEGTEIRFSFTGKSGKKWNLSLRDRRMAKLIRTIQELPGQNLFQYVEDGVRHQVCSQDVNAYIADAMGPDFTSKDFRTWGATVSAVLALEATELPASKRDRTKALNGVIDRVARLLCNTRTVCRRCYIHPAVIAAWEVGRLATEMQAIRKRKIRRGQGLDGDEALVLRWLSRNSAAEAAMRRTRAA